MALCPMGEAPEDFYDAGRGVGDRAQRPATQVFLR